jgi:SAM-dependent methyltransferase
MQLLAKSQQQFYTPQFFQAIQGASQQAAATIVPLLREIIVCDRVVDLGCGDGTWLHTFAQLGTQEILGIDGDYMRHDMLVIPPGNFLAFDLAKPIRLSQTFDLAMSLEVAEHLPAKAAPGFVDSLIRLAPVVLFSAAIPGQGGENHINEQWQDYWAKLFCQRGYVAIDYLRPKVWSNPQVAYWYSQNILLFVQSDYLERRPALQEKLRLFQVMDTASLNKVHPLLFLETMAAQEEIALEQFRSLWFKSLRRLVARRLGWAK